MWLGKPLVWLLTAAASLSALVSCSDGTPTPGPSSPPPFVGHVHGLGVDPADQVLYVAGHGGVFRLTDGRLELVADRAQDTMGFTVVGPHHFLASGHPAPTDPDRPVHLGLIESRDAAVTWTQKSLSGEADFHSLDQGFNAVYGYDSQTDRVLETADQITWSPVMTGDVYDLAAHPARPGVVLTATPKGVVLPAGNTQTMIAALTRLAFLEWPTAHVLVGVSEKGAVYQTADVGAHWTPAGRFPGTVEAFEANLDAWFAATDQGIYTTTDQGGSWTKLV